MYFIYIYNSSKKIGGLSNFIGNVEIGFFFIGVYMGEKKYKRGWSKFIGLKWYI